MHGYAILVALLDEAIFRSLEGASTQIPKSSASAWPMGQSRCALFLTLAPCAVQVLIDQVTPDAGIILFEHGPYRPMAV